MFVRPDKKDRELQPNFQPGKKAAAAPPADTATAQ